jgi:hypothetical protein
MKSRLTPSEIRIMPDFVAASPTDPKNILARTSDVRFRR